MYQLLFSLGSSQVYFKYGEEHYPEETVPPEYTFTETDGTVCRYITNFLVYNKRGERLLPIEVLVSSCPYVYNGVQISSVISLEKSECPI